MQFPSEIRLRSVPWSALAGLGDALVPALAEVLSGQKADAVLSRFLRARKGLDADGRRAVAEAIFGVGLWRRRLAWHAGEAQPEPGLARLLLFCLLRDLAGLAEGEAEALTGMKVTDLPQVREPPPAADLAHRFSMPDWLVRTLLDALGGPSRIDEAIALADALNLPGPVTLRTNTLRITRDELKARLEARGLDVRAPSWAPDALHLVTPRPNILGLPEHQEGLFETQDEGSQLLGALIGAQPGETVLDLCAGAGGKTLHLAAQLQNRGELHVHDADLSRLERLDVRARRAGIDPRILKVHRRQPPPDLLVDRGLVDAPCSELGPLRRGPDVRFRLAPSTFDALPPLQLALLERAYSHLRLGGRLVYATCTFRREECEEVALAFEKAHPDGLRRLTPGDGWLGTSFVTTEGFFRSFPHRHGSDGFFAAVWERTG